MIHNTYITTFRSAHWAVWRNESLEYERNISEVIETFEGIRL